MEDCPIIAEERKLAKVEGRRESAYMQRENSIKESRMNMTGTVMSSVYQILEKICPLKYS